MFSGAVLFHLARLPRPSRQPISFLPSKYFSEMSEQAGEASLSKVFRRSDHNQHKCKSARMSNIQFTLPSVTPIGRACSAEGQLDIFSEIVGQSFCAGGASALNRVSSQPRWIYWGSIGYDGPAVHPVTHVAH